MRSLLRLSAFAGLLCAALAGAGNARAATLVVTNTADNGAGSLRATIAAASDGDAIQFDPALNGQSISLTTAELVIDKNITISGPGPDLLSVSRSSGAPQFRIFHILPGHTVGIQGITISGGSRLTFSISDAGGGVFNDQATLAIDQCTVSNNRAYFTGGGIDNTGTLNIGRSLISNNTATLLSGGISNDAGGILTITDTTVSNNTSTGSNHQGAIGGGIYHVSSGMLTIRNSSINDNRAVGDGTQGSLGGGIYSTGRLAIIDSTVSGNSAVASAGGIYHSGTTTITHSTISQNSTSNRGAGIYSVANLTITDSTVSSNHTGINFQFYGDGGGIYHGGGALTILSSTVNDNRADGGANGSHGGGVYCEGAGSVAIGNSTFSGNFARFNGGAIFNASPLTISNCTFSSNSSNGAAGGIFTGGTNVLFQIGNTVLNAGNPGANIVSSGSGAIISLGYNLSSDNGGGFLTGPGDLINTNPVLGPLHDNGGPTSTHALLPGSPAINTGNPAFTPPPSYDQRGLGYDRVANGRIDIGSFEVQPTPTPTPTPTPCLPVITQSSSQVITTANSASCNDGATHTDNSYWRAFDMASFANGGQYCINSLSFGVEFANTTQPVTVRLYTTSNFPAGFPGSLIQIAATTLNVGSADNGTVVTTPLVVTVPAGTPQLVMELFTPNGQPGGYRFFVGSNAALETGPSYFSAPACGITTPATTAASGFPNMHIVFGVNGTCTCPTPTPCPLFNATGTVGQCTTAGPSGIALAGVTITRTISGGAGGGSTTTDENGNYFLSGFSCVTNTFTPSKAARLPGSSGIDTTDVLAVQRHFLAISLLTGCRLAAADCASPVGISTTDVIAIQRFFLGRTTGIGNVGSYSFTPASRSYPPLSGNQTAQNYDAIVFGDVASPFAAP